jgi:hypothetical protein
MSYLSFVYFYRNLIARSRKTIWIEDEGLYYL